MKEITKKSYDHATRICEYPECGKRAATRGKQHGDGTLYRGPWCKFHLKGKGKEARIGYSLGKKKYLPKSLRKLA